MIKFRIACSVFPLLVTCVLSGSALRAENWPEWRGPTRNGISTESNLPTKWNSEGPAAASGIAWKTPLPGSGVSQPIVWNDRIFITSSDGARQETLHIVCLNRDSGKIVWQQRM